MLWLAGSHVLEHFRQANRPVTAVTAVTAFSIPRGRVRAGEASGPLAGRRPALRGRVVAGFLAGSVELVRLGCGGGSWCVPRVQRRVSSSPGAARGGATESQFTEIRQSLSCRVSAASPFAMKVDFQPSSFRL